MFHFIFHSVPNLPEALLAGKERIYLTHFYSIMKQNAAAFGEEDVDEYVRAYEQPGAIRCALEVYRSFEKDAGDNRGYILNHGKCSVPTLMLSGEFSGLAQAAEQMAMEVTEANKVEVARVQDSGHWIAEENPSGFVEHLRAFIRKHN